jgi:hypothetical protein
MSTSWRTGLCLAMGILIFAGCRRGDGLKRHRVAGTVTFKGQPVEFGAIFFEPTVSVGKIAPTVYLPIRGGKYDTGTEGPIAGNYVVKVGGMDQSKQQKDSDGITHTPSLFPDYKIDVEIPPPGGRLDIEVPTASSDARGNRR